MRTVFRRLAPVALVATGACFATSNDVKLLQSQVETLQQAQSRSDVARAAQLTQVIASLGLVRDSLGIMSTRMIKMQGDVRGDLYDLGQQLIQVQQLTGQSQNRLQDLRASLEARNQQESSGQAQPASPTTSGAAVKAPTGAGAPGATPAPSNVPGPNQLYQLSMEQLQRGSPSAARIGLQTLLQQYPTADIAPEAQFYLGEAYRAEGNAPAADSAYAVVLQRFPKSPHAPTALYKRALYMEQQGNLTGARAALNDLITAYPRSDEAALARDHLRDMK
jgi:tol-pal system protein YbgF